MPIHLPCRRPLSLLLAALAMAAAAPGARATNLDLTWDADGVSGGATGGTGNWTNGSGTLWDNAGTMQAWDNTASPPDNAIFGGTAGTVTLTSGITAHNLTFNTAGYTVTGNTLTLGGTTPTVTANANATIGSALAGTAGLTVAGTGTLSVTQGNLTGLSGGITVNTGAHLKSDMSASTGQISIGNITVNGTGIYEAYNTNTTTDGTLLIGGGQLQGTGVFQKTGAGYLDITWGGNAYGIGNFNGTFDVQGGTLAVNNGTVGSGNAALSIASGAKVDVRTGTFKVDALNGVAGSNVYVSFTSGGTLSVGNNNGSGTFAGTLTNGGSALSLVKNGSGTQTLTGALSYNGSTTVNNGILEITDSAGQTLGSGATSIAAGATLRINVTNAGSTISTGNTGNHGATGAYTGGGTYVKTGVGTWSMNWNGAGAVSFDSGALIDIQQGSLFLGYGGGNWSANKADLNVATGATFDLWDNASGVFVNKLTGGGTVTRGTGYNAGAGTLTLGVDNGTGATFSGAITNGSGSNGTIAIVKVGTGTQTLSGANTYTGATTVNAGTLVLSGLTGSSNNANVGGNQLSTTGLATVSGSTLELSMGTGSATKFASANGGLAISGTGVVKLSNGYWYLGNGGGGTTLGQSAGGWIDVRAGATLSNDYANANWSGNNGSLNVDGSFDLRNNNAQVDALTGSGAIYDNGFTNTLTIGVAGTTNSATYGVSGNTATFGGTLGVGGTTLALTKNGSGTQILTGANTYTGTTTVNGGTLTASASSAFTYLSGNTVVASGATFNINNTSTSSGTSSSSVNLFANDTATRSITGGGTINLNLATGSYWRPGQNTTINLSSGAQVNMNSGDFQLGWSSTATSTNKADLSIGAGAYFRSSNTMYWDALTGSGNLTNAYNGTPTFYLGNDNGSGDFSGTISNGGTFNGVTTGALNIQKTGTGTQTFSGANTYTGNTTVNNGTLIVNGTHAAGTGGYAVNGTANGGTDGATLGGHGTITTTGGVAIKTGAQITGGALGSFDTVTAANNILKLNVGTSKLTLAGTYLCDINYSALAGNQADGAKADLIQVTGDVDFTNAKLNLSGTNVAPTQGTHYAIKLISWTGSATGAASDWNTANITGLQAGQSVVRWGNAYYLVPEPASFALLGLGSLLLLRRPGRRRKSAMA